MWYTGQQVNAYPLEERKIQSHDDFDEIDEEMSAQEVANELLFDAARNGSPADICTAFAAGAKVEAEDEIGTTALMFAAEYNTNPDVLKALLDAGAEVNACDNSGKKVDDYLNENERVAGSDAYFKIKNYLSSPLVRSLTRVPQD